MNQLREQSGLDSTPLKLIFRQRTGKIDFAELKDENKNQRNMGDKDKKSRNKLKKSKLRKVQGQRKKERNA
jgi:GTP-binding protein